MAHFKALCLHVTRMIVDSSNIRLAGLQARGFKLGTS